MDVMIVSGVRLDHAWVGLGAPFGSALRDWSRQVLALVVEEANRRHAGVLLVAGDLFDRSYALPATVDYASQILGTFSGEVVIVPGRGDWFDGTSLYDTHAWASNISICRSAEYQPCVTAPAVWASAWTSPGGSAPRVPAATEPRVLVRAEAADYDDRVLAVPHLVHDPREPDGFALLIDIARPSEPARRVDLPRQPGRAVDVDVTNTTETEALFIVLEEVLIPDEPMLLRLVGTLAPGVLLPGFGGPERTLPPGVVLDLESLTFSTPPVDPADHSARAEFIHAMAYANTPDLQRHQTTALGLAALADSSRET